MADPIKTQIMKAIETLMGEITEIGSVQRWYDIPVDLDTLTCPALFYWEEEDRDLRNRIAIGELSVYMGVFFKLISTDGPGYQIFNDQADIVAGKIIDKLSSPAALRAVGMIRIEESWIKKALSSEFYGELSIMYQLTYGHVVGDSTSINFS